MPEAFSSEELGLIRRFHAGGRRRLLVDLIAATADFVGDALDVAVAALEKLSRMSDAAFDTLMLSHHNTETEV